MNGAFLLFCASLCQTNACWVNHQAATGKKGTAALWKSSGSTGYKAATDHDSIFQKERKPFYLLLP